MTKHELIKFCQSRDNEVCNFCPAVKECDVFFTETDQLPMHMEGSEHDTDEVIEV